MITDWVEESEDLKKMLRRYRVSMHPKIRQGKVTCWFFYSKAADVYSATIKYRDQKTGRKIFYISPNASRVKVAIDAILEIEAHYAQKSSD